MASEKTESTFQDYLQHHLQNLVYGKLPAGYERENKDGTVEVLTNDTWTFAYNKSEVAEMGFWAFHVDTLFLTFAGWYIFVFLYQGSQKLLIIQTNQATNIY